MSSGQSPDIQCPNCGIRNASHARFCTSCGATFSGLTQVQCPNCGALSAGHARFCTSCGASFPGLPNQGDSTPDNHGSGFKPRDYITNRFNEGESGLSRAGFLIGIIAICIFVVALVPCLGCINYINIPLGLAGAVLNIIVMARGEGTGKTTVALVLCGVAVILGFFRLALGGFVI